MPGAQRVLLSRTSCFFIAEPGIFWGKSDVESIVTGVKRTTREKYRMVGVTKLTFGCLRPMLQKALPDTCLSCDSVEAFGVG